MPINKYQIINDLNEFFYFASIRIRNRLISKWPICLIGNQIPINIVCSTLKSGWKSKSDLCADSPLAQYNAVQHCAIWRARGLIALAMCLIHVYKMDRFARLVLLLSLDFVVVRWLAMLCRCCRCFCWVYMMKQKKPWRQCQSVSCMVLCWSFVCKRQTDTVLCSLYERNILFEWIGAAGSQTLTQWIYV